MKIGLVVPGFSSSYHDWCIPVVTELARELSRRCELHVFAIRYPPRRQTYRCQGAIVHSCDGRDARGWQRGPLLLRVMREIFTEHRRGRFDALHGLWLDEPGFIAAVMGRLLSVPTLASEMGGELVALPEIGYGGQLNWVNTLLASSTMSLASCLTSGSYQGVARIQAHTGKTPVHWAPLGIDPEIFHAGMATRHLEGLSLEPRHPVVAGPSAGQPCALSDGSNDRQIALEGGFRILHVGSLLPVKDQEMLLRAFRHVLQKEPTAHLHIVGDGQLRAALEEKACALRVRDAVTFHGQARREEMAGFYRAAHVLVVSSRHEAQHVATVEAMLCGLPVAGTRVGCLGDLAPSAALAVAVGDDVALAAALLSLTSSTRRQSVVAAGYTEASNHYSVAGTVNNLMKLYAEAARTLPRPVRQRKCNPHTYT